MLTFSLALTLMPALILLATLEAWLRRRRGLDYDWKSYWASFGDVLGRVLLLFVLTASVATPLLNAVAEWRLTTLAMDRAWHWALLLLGQDFCYYWMHRAQHRVRWFWLNHAVHHSPTDFTLSAAYRLGWTARITGSIVCFAPLVWFGFPLPLVLATLTWNLTYQFWLHTELIDRLPRPIEWLFNTPSHHRAHHGRNPEYVDCNYGGVLIVFDRLFGTFRAERAEVPVRYGLVEPLRSYNPVRIAFHAWAQMLRDLRAARSLREGLRVVFGPPEFKPAARATERMRA